MNQLYLAADSDCNYGLLSPCLSRAAFLIPALKTIIFKSFQVCYGRRTADDGERSGTKLVVDRFAVDKQGKDFYQTRQE
ncbi:hypothetical protein OUZ56_031450 [Daphnia magna]|uniref:Uncharacterized protein n=1 Tax=Daphnia magna TaxID=35525 RepID=A0ABQ9ZV29_9CRUS|nr:hypothetical protein OUZ56_031450 [Daphnia magna]